MDFAKRFRYFSLIFEGSALTIMPFCVSLRKPAHSELVLVGLEST